MAQDGTTEPWQHHRAGQDKYTYFLLAAASAAIAFSVQKTEGLALSWSMASVGLAMVAWGCTFYFGCKNLIWVQTSLLANYSLLQLKGGSHPEQPDHPALLDAAMRGVRSAVDSNVAKAQFHAIWQFRLLIAGAVLFLACHVWRLYAASGTASGMELA